jgi:indole-3-glycerol phosphate synthase
VTVDVGRADLLETIVAATRRILEVRVAREPLAGLERRAAAARPRSDHFRAALARMDRVNIIGECKRRSPSRGLLRKDYDPGAIARAYESGGAAAISVLTEPTFFDGRLDHVAAVRRAVDLPILRKDFLVSEYQVFEARAAGADAILLIVAALDDASVKALLATAGALEMACLVEVHNPGELERAIAAGADIIGVNNRDLRTLDVDVEVSHELIARIPSSVLAVAESGLGSDAELRALREAGYRAFLIGERLMTHSDPAALLRGLTSSPPTD